jgi:drug/metabolite transporter (DMT)-like permease
MVFATLVFWGIGLLAPKEEVGKRDLWTIFWGALFGLVGAQVSFANALLYTSPVNITIIAAMTPLAVMLIAALILKEPVTFKKAAGVLIGASGALLIIFQSSAINTDSSGNWIGNLLCIVNVITYAIYLVITRPISQRYSAITLMKWMFLFSALISFPPGISDLPEAKVFGTESNPFVILKLSYIVIMATGIAYFLVPMALKRIRPTTASMYNNLQPIIASIIAILIGQDVFSWDKPIAALLVFTGVYLVTQSKAKEEVKGIK